MVQAWYQGGISVFDWTDAAHPKEIAFFDRGPVDSTKMAQRRLVVGLLVQRRHRELRDRARARHLRATPSAFISQNEIDAAKTVHLDYLNTQGQPKMVWPPSFALARAYVDQLERSKGLDGGKIAAARKALAGAEKASGAARQDALTSWRPSWTATRARPASAAKVRTLAGAVQGAGVHQDRVPERV